MYNRKHQTEYPIRYAHILRSAGLQMSLVRLTDAISPSSASSASSPPTTMKNNTDNKSTTFIQPRNEMDFEMHDFTDNNVSAAHINTTNSQPPSVPTPTTIPSHRPKLPPPAKAPLLTLPSSRPGTAVLVAVLDGSNKLDTLSSPDDYQKVDRSPLCCTCLTCERAAIEAKAGAVAYKMRGNGTSCRQWSLGELPGMERGGMGLGVEGM